MKKFICGLTVVAMTTLNCLTGFAVTFSDINDVPWAGAQTYINNAANAGLMAGENNSNGQTIFRAKSNVTYSESVQLAYNLLRKTSGANTSSAVITKWTTVMQSFNIPTWAYEATAYMLENSIITTTDVVKFMKNANNSNYATREDVAVLFGKVLAKTNTLDYAARLSFNDANLISNGSIAYIELLARLNILVGDANNRFNPKNNINRAEMAVITYKTYESLNVVVAAPSQVTGTVVSNKEISTGRYTLNLLVNGKEKIFVAPNTVQVVNGSKIVSPSTIGAKDIILITYQGYEISAATITYDAVVEKESSEFEGIITYLRPDKIKIKALDLNIYTYDVDKKVSIKLDGKTRDLDYLIDEYNDEDDISVVLTVDDDTVEKIVATTKDSDKDDDSDYDGEITSLTTSRLKISGKSTYYEIEDEDEIDVDVEDGRDDTLSDFDDLKLAYDQGKIIDAKIYMDDDYVVKIEGEVVEVPGYFNSVNTRYNTVKIKIGSKYYEYEYEDEDDVDVEINGKVKVMDDLEDVTVDNLPVKLVLEDNYIVEIYVGSSINSTSPSKSNFTIEGDLTSITSSKLKVSTENSYYLIEDEDEVEVWVEDGAGDAITDISGLEEAIDSDKAIEVTVYIQDNYVVEIQGEVVGVTGQLYTVKTSGTIRIKTSEGYYTYDCSDNVDIAITNIDTLTQLRTLVESSNVKVELTIKNGYVVKIES